MPAPKRYERDYSFAGYQATSPSRPLPGPALDNELENVEASLNSTISGLMDIRRSDGALKNGIVTAASLSPEISTGVAPAVPWVTDHSYLANDVVFEGATFYRALNDHISTVFATDLALGRWEVVADLTPIVTDAEAARDAAAASAVAADASADAAAASAITADGSADAAAASAVAADASADAAAVSAVAADGSADDAADAAAVIIALYARELGEHPSDPTTRNDLSPLQVGDRYIKTPDGVYRMWFGVATGWRDTGDITPDAILRSGVIIATAGQTSFTIPGGYTAGSLFFWLNGHILVPGTDVTITSGTVAVLAVAAELSDEAFWMAPAAVRDVILTTAIPDGSLAAPSIAFNSDLDTGWFRAAADTIAKVLGGVEAERDTAAQKDMKGRNIVNVGSLNGVAVSSLVADTRQVATSGLASGGGTLAADRTIDVPIASQAEAEAGALNTKAMTPLRVAQQVAADTTVVKTARQVTGSGLASGGGTLAADRTIDVTPASQAEAEAGAVNTKAMTPLRVAQQVAADTTLVKTTRQVATSGLASGGGTLAADRTIDVPIASQAEAEAGAVNTKAMTPLRTAQYIASIGSTAASKQVVQVFTAGGTYTPTTGMVSAIIECIGGGGGGGGATGNAAFMTSGGGGGAGGYSVKRVLAADIGASKAVTVGAAGTAGAAAGNGGAGGDTSVGTLCVAKGGPGGSAGTSGGFGGGGAGGAASSGTGDHKVNGSTGETGPYATASAGPAGRTAPGGVAAKGGAIGVTFATAGGIVNGLAATANTGNGGGGGVSNFVATNSGGGAGGSGIVIITEMVVG